MVFLKYFLLAFIVCQWSVAAETDSFTAEIEVSSFWAKYRWSEEEGRYRYYQDMAEVNIDITSTGEFIDARSQYTASLGCIVDNFDLERERGGGHGRRVVSFGTVVDGLLCLSPRNTDNVWDFAIEHSNDDYYAGSTAPFISTQEGRDEVQKQMIMFWLKQFYARVHDVENFTVNTDMTWVEDGPYFYVQGNELELNIPRVRISISMTRR